MPTPDPCVTFSEKQNDVLAGATVFTGMTSVIGCCISSHLNPPTWVFYALIGYGVTPPVAACAAVTCVNTPTCVENMCITVFNSGGNRSAERRPINQSTRHYGSARMGDNTHNDINFDPSSTPPANTYAAF